MMATVCTLPDPDIGVVLRLSTYLDCQGRALGENGFAAVIGGPVWQGLLLSIVTIFVALIGYRLIFGQIPNLGDGIGLTVRLGFVLALTTGWPAFQTLVYRVAFDGPGQIAATILPGSGLPFDKLDLRVQQAYDTLRLGYTTSPQSSQLTSSNGPEQQTGTTQTQRQSSSIGTTTFPQTATLFAVSTSGIAGALRIAMGFLLAVGPFAIIGLLFDATLGLFSGWIRALGGAALALLASTIVTAIDLTVVESELGHLQVYAQGLRSEAVDPQALPTIVLLFAIAMLVAVLAAARMASAFLLQRPRVAVAASGDGQGSRPVARAEPVSYTGQMSDARSIADQAAEPTRASAIADALAATVRREQVSPANMPGGGETPQAPTRTVLNVAQARDAQAPFVVPLGIVGRRSIGRRTRSAASRDRA